LKRLDDLLRNLIGRLELTEAQERQKILGEWDNIVGKELGALAHPAGFRKSVLLIKALHPAAAMEIRLRKKEILDHLNCVAHKRLFTSVRIICKSAGSGIQTSER
jgi:predicted nucleic acid-binding Zn ribbon protein